MPLAPGFPRFQAVGDCAVLVEFAESPSDPAHAAVLDLDAALAAAGFPGFTEAVPAYVSLMAVFDPGLTDHVAAERALRALVTAPARAADAPATHEVPVCYDADLAPDLAAVAAQSGLSAEAVVAAHLAGRYRVFLYGFAPGYAYLGGVPPAIQLPRKPAALRGVASGSVIIAGPQCIVTTLTMPTGWWIVGRSPALILTGDPERPFLFGVGDHVRFRRIARAAFEAARGAGQGA